MASTATVCLALASLILFAEAENKLARGWSDSINWFTLNTGWEQSKLQGKPLMLLIHKSWCRACQAFKPKFSESKEILHLSKKFIMVNVEDKEEPSEAIYKPDGAYVPRILFFDSKGKLLDKIYNKDGDANYKHYYTDPNGVVQSMEAVLKKTSRKKKKKAKKEL